MRISGIKYDGWVHLIFFLNIAFIVVFFIALINRDFPEVGHDYAYHIPRMLDTHLHNLINGPIIQWYTPSFGGGLPAYPNPQHIQYSLPQLLTYFFNPWLSLILSAIVYALVGAVSFYLFLREIGLSTMASSLGATFIIANGFYLERLIVGHIGYQQFPLLGLILLACFTKKMDLPQSGTVIGIALALIIHQAGFFLIIIFWLTMIVCLPLLYLLRPATYKGTSPVFTFISGNIVAVFLSLSKLSAISSFMRYFPREISDNYGLSYLQGLKGLAVQLFGFSNLAPILLFTNRNVNEIPDILGRFTGGGDIIWETDISLSASIFLLSGIYLFILGRKITQRKISLTKGKTLAFVLLAIAIWLTVDFSLAQGPLYSITKSLPILKSVHVNMRFAATFIFPASIIAAYSFDTATRQYKLGTLVSYLVLIGISSAALLPYYFLNAETHNRNFDLTLSLETYDQIKDGRRFLIKKIADVPDAYVFQYNASNSGLLYEALFGYELENFHPKIETGSVYKTDGIYYNMTNPASYVFPKENNLSLFERFRTDQENDLKRFVDREQPKFNMPVLQHISNILNLATLIIVVVYVVFQIKSPISKTISKVLPFHFEEKLLKVRNK